MIKTDLTHGFVYDNIIHTLPQDLLKHFSSPPGIKCM